MRSPGPQPTAELELAPEIAINSTPEIAIGSTQEIAIGSTQEIAIGSTQEIAIGSTQEIAISSANDIILPMVSADFLTTVPIFSGLKPDDLKPLTGKLRRRGYQKGEVIFHQDDPADRMHIIVDGRIRISITSDDGREKDLAILKSGECFGEMALLDGSNRSATATAVDPTQTLALYRDDFMEFLQIHPGVVTKTTSLLTSRLRVVNQMLGDLAFLDVPTRVAKQLLELSEAYVDESASDAPVEIPMGQDELARLVGASRETISRALNSYRRLGILSTSHRRITINDPEALERMASF